MHTLGVESGSARIVQIVKFCRGRVLLVPFGGFGFLSCAWLTSNSCEPLHGNACASLLQLLTDASMKLLVLYSPGTAVLVLFSLTP